MTVYARGQIRSCPPSNPQEPHVHGHGRLLPNWRNWTWLALTDLIPVGRGHNFTVDERSNETIMRCTWASDRLGAT